MVAASSERVTNKSFEHFFPFKWPFVMGSQLPRRVEIKLFLLPPASHLKTDVEFVLLRNFLATTNNSIFKVKWMWTASP